MLTYARDGRTVQVAFTDRTSRRYYQGEGWELAEPAKSARKADWVEYVMAARGLSRADAEALPVSEMATPKPKRARSSKPRQRKPKPVEPVEPTPTVETDTET